MPRPQFVLAVLLVNGRYALQLRDDKPEIYAPNQWGLFGGSLEEGESPQSAIAREVEEELSIRVPSFDLLWDIDNTNPTIAPIAHYLIYEADVSRQWRLHRLREGQSAQLFAFDELDALSMPPLIRAILLRHRKIRLQKTGADA